MRALAQTISVLFHPLLMATYGCVLMFYGIRNTIFDYLTPADAKWRITLIVFIFSFAFPVLTILIMYRLKRLPSLALPNQSDRTFPYIMTSIFYFGLFYLMSDINIWSSLKYSILGAGIAILLTAIINLRYKISAHMVGIGGLFGILVSLSFLIRFDMTPFYIACIFVAGLIGTSRLYLQQHRPSQLYAGFLLGLFVQTALFFIAETINFT